MPYEEISVMQHRLELDGRERLLVTGVEEVERFDGAIHTLLYEDKGPSGGQGGFLRRLFG